MRATGPKLFEVLLESLPKVGSCHVVVRGQQEIVFFTAKIESLPEWHICAGDSSHLSIRSELLHMAWIPPIVMEVHDDLDCWHVLSRSKQLIEILWNDSR